MAQQRFHVDVEYRLYGRGESTARASVKLRAKYRHRTLPQFRSDRVLVLEWLDGEQERFRRDVAYEIAGPANIRASVKYVHRYSL
jgi:hypothetical protein